MAISNTIEGTVLGASGPVSELLLEATTANTGATVYCGSSTNDIFSRAIFATAAGTYSLLLPSGSTQVSLGVGWNPVLAKGYDPANGDTASETLFFWK